MANTNILDWDQSVLGSGLVPVWLRPFQGDTERLSRGLDPVSWRCLKAGPDFWEISGRSRAGAKQQSGSSGGEDTAKPEMMLKCESLVGVYIARRQRIHHGHVSEIGAASGHGKNCALSRNSVLRTALPDQHGAVKLNTTANIRLARCFSPSSLSRDNNPDPPKGFHHSCGSRMSAYS